MAVEFRVVGIDRAVKQLKELDYKTRKKVMRKAVRAGIAPIVKAAKRNAPQTTGLLKRSITTKVKTYAVSGTVVGVVGQRKVKREDGRYTAAAAGGTKKLKKGRGGISGRGDVVPIHLVENAVSPHSITAIRAQALAIGARMGYAYVYHVNHPGHRGRHFMDAAVRQSEGQSMRAFRDKLEFEIDRELNAATFGNLQFTIDA